jgi:hypothetical protein
VHPQFTRPRARSSILQKLSEIFFIFPLDIFLKRGKLAIVKFGRKRIFSFCEEKAALW